jgi:hypothetical protein
MWRLRRHARFVPMSEMAQEDIFAVIGLRFQQLVRR